MIDNKDHRHGSRFSDIPLAFTEFPRNLDLLIPVWIFRSYWKLRYPRAFYRIDVDFNRVIGPLPERNGNL